MDYDETVSVLALVVDPDSEATLLRPMCLNVAGTIAAIVEGSIEAIEPDSGSVFWLDESDKNRRLATNTLATKAAHRLSAGLRPDDTINRCSLIVGETTGPFGDLFAPTSRRPRLRRLIDLGSTSRQVRWEW